MPFPLIGLALSGLSALGGLFGGRSQKQEAFNESSFNQTGTSTNTSTPNLSPEQKQLQDVFVRALIDRYNTGTDLSGYAAGGLRSINQSSDAANKLVGNILAARGLTYSPYAASVLGQGEVNRVGQQASFLNTLPLLSRQLQGEDIAGLVSGFSAIPTGYTTTGTTTQSGANKQKGTQLIPGNMLGGFFSGLGQGLAAPVGQSSTLASILRSLGIGG